MEIEEQLDEADEADDLDVPSSSVIKDMLGIDIPSADGCGRYCITNGDIALNKHGTHLHAMGGAEDVWANGEECLDSEDSTGTEWKYLDITLQPVVQQGPHYVLHWYPTSDYSIWYFDLPKTPRPNCALVKRNIVLAQKVMLAQKGMDNGKAVDSWLFLFNDFFGGAGQIFGSILMSVADSDTDTD